MTTKKLILFLVLVLFHLQSSTTKSQVIITIERPALNQITVQDLWKLTLNNPTKETFTVYFQGTVNEPSQGKIYEGTSSEFQLKPGIQRVRISDLDITSNFYIKEYEEIIMRTGTAPEGNYQICVNVINTKNKAQIGRGCINHPIIAQRYIQLISPVNSEIINQGTQIIFKHGSVVLQNDHLPEPPPPPKKKFTIRIVEINKGQSPESAINNNTAFFKSESENLITIYPVGARKFEANKTYAWNVTAYENNKEIATSDVWTFTIANQTPEITKIQLISPLNNSTINYASGLTSEKNKIKFYWKLPDALSNELISYNLRIVKVKEGQLLEEAIKINEPVLEAKEIKNSLYEVFATKDTNKIDTTGRRRTRRLIHPGSVTGEIIYQSGAYAWQVIAVLPSGRIIPSEIFSFTFSLESTTVTSCGWPTLINEFPIKSDETNVIMTTWGSSTSIPTFKIPCISADSVWGGAIGCCRYWESGFFWPPIIPSCPWHALYSRGACWIASSEFDWKNVPNPLERIYKNYFLLDNNVTNVRLYIACDDEVEIYIDPTSSPLNNTNPGFIGSYNTYESLGIINLPDLRMGDHNLILKLKNIYPRKMALIYGIDYILATPPPPTDPPTIGFPSIPLRYCYNSETSDIDIRASLLGRINRHCTGLTITSTDGIRETMTFTPMSEPILIIEHTGIGGDDLSYSAFVRLSALWLFERLAGTEINCANFTATLKAGNGDCTEFSEQSWNFTIDIDNRSPEVSFILPPLTIPTTIPDYRLIVPLTEPRKYEKIEEPGGYCLGLPLPEQIQMDISWASGLDSRDIILGVQFQRKHPVPTEEEPNIFTFPESDIIINIDRSVLSFHLENTSSGHRLWMVSSIITAYLLDRGITLQEGDLLTFSIVFPDNPCICERTNFQTSFRFKICL